jgi:hypothetical protein
MDSEKKDKQEKDRRTAIGGLPTIEERSGKHDDPLGEAAQGQPGLRLTNDETA